MAKPCRRKPEQWYHSPGEDGGKFISAIVLNQQHYKYKWVPQFHDRIGV